MHSSCHQIIGLYLGSRFERIYQVTKTNGIVKICSRNRFDVSLSQCRRKHAPLRTDILSMSSTRTASDPATPRASRIILVSPGPPLAVATLCLSNARARTMCCRRCSCHREWCLEGPSRSGKSTFYQNRAGAGLTRTCRSAKLRGYHPRVQGRSRM